MTRLLERSWLGEEMCLPPARHFIQPYRNLEASREEVELVIFYAMTTCSPRGSHALVVSTETITPNYYVGKERAKAWFRLSPVVRTLHRRAGQRVPVRVPGGGRGGPPGCRWSSP